MLQDSYALNPSLLDYSGCNQARRVVASVLVAKANDQGSIILDSQNSLPLQVQL